MSTTLGPATSSSCPAACPARRICAAPSILAELGLLDGRVATCYPGCEGAFPAGVRPEELGVYTDDNLVTASGPGFAVDFGLALLELLEGAEAARRIAAGMLVGR